MKSRVLLIRSSCLIALLVAVSGHAGAQGNPPKEETNQPPVGKDAGYQHFTGRIAAVQSVELRSRATGYLVKIHFKAGSAVKKDELLFEIDPRPYQTELDKAEANIRLVEAQVQLTAANLKRAKDLLPKGVIAREEYDRTEADLRKAESALVVARADVQMARLNLEFTKIRAPFDGKIGQPALSVGNLVDPKKQLATMYSVDPMYVFFDIDERTLLRMRRAKQEAKQEEPLTVGIGLADETDYPHSGKVDFVDVQLDPKVGTIQVRAVVPNPKGLFLPGMFVRVRLNTGLAAKPLKPGAKKESPDAQAKLKDLLKERHDLLTKIVDQLMFEYKAGKINFKPIVHARRAALEAGLEVSQGAPQRIDLLRKELGVFEDYLKLAERQVKAGITRPLEMLEAQATVLDVRIKLLREEAKENPRK